MKLSHRVLIGRFHCTPHRALVGTLMVVALGAELLALRGVALSMSISANLLWLVFEEEEA